MGSGAAGSAQDSGGAADAEMPAGSGGGSGRRVRPRARTDQEAGKDEKKLKDEQEAKAGRNKRNKSYGEKFRDHMANRRKDKPKPDVPKNKPKLPLLTENI